MVVTRSGEKATRFLEILHGLESIAREQAGCEKKCIRRGNLLAVNRSESPAQGDLLAVNGSHHRTVCDLLAVNSSHVSH
jgi:hypothetical protein